MNKQRIAYFVTGAGLIGAALSQYPGAPHWMLMAGLALAGAAKVARSFMGPTPASTDSSTSST